MASKLGTFKEVVQRSGLLLSDVLEQSLAEHESQFEGLVDEQSFARWLVDQNLLTRWQTQNLLSGKHRGYFVDQYKIQKLIGRGGHANVYLVEHTGLKLDRVMKVISPSKLNKGTSLKQRFLREAQETAKLDHRNVVRCFDIALSEKISYIILEYCRGLDLEKLVRRDGPQSFRRSVECVRQAAVGLEYVRKKGLIHRDIKPANLLLTEDGVIKILDLGLAMLDHDDDEDGSLTEIYEDNLGTADYIAPEQALSSHNVDFRADIYSLGCTLYHMISGRPPFNKGSVMQRIAKHQSVMPPCIRDLRPECPEELANLCWKMIQKKPEDRFDSYQDLVRQCEFVAARLAKVRSGQPMSSQPALVSGQDGFTNTNENVSTSAIESSLGLMPPSISDSFYASANPYGDSSSAMIATDSLTSASRATVFVEPPKSSGSSIANPSPVDDAFSSNMGSCDGQVVTRDSKYNVLRELNSSCSGVSSSSTVTSGVATDDPRDSDTHEPSRAEEVDYQSPLKISKASFTEKGPNSRWSTVKQVVGILLALGLAIGGATLLNSLKGSDSKKPRPSIDEGNEIVRPIDE